MLEKCVAAKVTTLKRNYRPVKCEQIRGDARFRIMTLAARTLPVSIDFGFKMMITVRNVTYRFFFD